MEIHQPAYVASYPKESLCPKDGLPEFAFIGRSNVGKSSLINMLTKRKALAKVSSTPGKTQMLNFFLIDETWYLVDLPGYGYAKVPKSLQANLARMIDDYLVNRQSLTLAFVLIDASLPPRPNDLQFINGLGEHGVPFSILFTKSDRLGKSALTQNVQAFMDALAENWEELPRYFITSSSQNTGRKEILDYIGSILKKL